jgi:hypothetical protein
LFSQNDLDKNNSSILIEVTIFIKWWFNNFVTSIFQIKSVSGVWHMSVFDINRTLSRVVTFHYFHFFKLLLSVSTCLYWCRVMSDACVCVNVS